jgi:prepilin-type N-terminal cleavage/methylation domain-containing protein
MIMKIVNQKSKFKNAFTLIELLVVIAVIAVIVGFTIPVLGYVKRTQYVSHATGEMNQIETALESYKNAYHFYPPCNGTNYLLNQLYYELIGTTNFMTNSADAFATIDNSTSPLMRADVQNAFGNISAFVNCSKAGAGGEDFAAAQTFLRGLKPNQFMTFTNKGVSVTLLVTAVGGPDPTYKPLGVLDLNPWRYRYPGVNNPNGYDLWIQLDINGQMNLVCNWSKKPHINDLSVP